MNLFKCLFMFKNERFLFEYDHELIRVYRRGPKYWNDIWDSFKITYMSSF
jgi:hypothetical protein